jgi:hypothetical protein
VVIKGSARGGPAKLAVHLERTDTNEKMRVVEMRGVAAVDLDGALKEMDALGAALNTKRTLYHASINTRADETMTPGQWIASVDRLEERLGLTGQPRVIVEHKKEGREHIHIVWSRTDLEHMRAIRCDHNYRTHEEVARALEQEFGHARVQGAHAERDGKPRPDRTPSHADMQQADRTGLTPKQAKEQITALWRRTDNGQAFSAALSDAGWTLARGDRRDFVVIDPYGAVHSLARRVDGVAAKDVRERLADIDAGKLPSVAQVRAVQGKGAPRARAEARPAAPLVPARKRSESGKPIASSATRTAAPPARGQVRPAKVAAKAAGGFFGAASKLLDRVSTGIEQLLGGGPSVPERQQTKGDAMPQPEEKTPHEQVVSAEEARATRRQALIEKYGGEIEPNREAEIAAGVRKRDEDRSR